MKLLADECCDTALVAALRKDGHDVLYVVETLRGTTDEEVLKRADEEERILLTEDKDFGELVYRLKRPARGIVLLRFDVADHASKLPRLLGLLNTRSDHLYGAFVVLDKTKTRIRPLRKQR